MVQVHWQKYLKLIPSQDIEKSLLLVLAIPNQLSLSLLKDSELLEI